MRFFSLDLSDKSKELLQNFLDDCGGSLSSFRYYESRDFDAVKNHITSFLLYDGNLCVGYGHLDKDGDDVWLGICVKENYTGLGYGKIIMNNLTNSYDRDILLSVDKNNKSAINLYEKYDFVVKTEKADNYIMERK
jgi:ribosomal protein S18 acetylase RimI-like enzyme